MGYWLSQMRPALQQRGVILPLMVLIMLLQLGSVHSQDDDDDSRWTTVGTLDLVLPPSSSNVKFIPQSFPANGIADLSKLVFQTTQETGSTVLSMVDLVMFEIQRPCPAGQQCGEEFSELGLGALTSNGKHHNNSEPDSGSVHRVVDRWCCTERTLEDGLCQPEQLGRLITKSDASIASDQRIGTYFHGFVPISQEGPVMANLTSPRFENTAGAYLIMIANCNDLGRTVRVHGPMVWKKGEVDGTIVPSPESVPVPPPTPGIIAPSMPPSDVVDSMTPPSSSSQSNLEEQGNDGISILLVLGPILAGLLIALLVMIHLRLKEIRQRILQGQLNNAADSSNLDMNPEQPQQQDSSPSLKEQHFPHPKVRPPEKHHFPPALREVPTASLRSEEDEEEGGIYDINQADRAESQDMEDDDELQINYA